MINVDLPDDVRRYVLAYQGQMKEKTGRGQYSQPDTVIFMVKEHKELKMENETLKDRVKELEALLSEYNSPAQS